MQDDSIEMAIDSWDRFRTRFLVVETCLLGQSMEFMHNGRLARVQLPGEEHIVPWPGTSSALSATLSAWYNREDRKVPKEYTIHCVDLTMSTGKAMTLPRGILSGADAMDVTSKEQRDELDTIVKQANEWSVQALEKWFRVVRWKMMNSRIGRHEIRGPESGWSTHLRDKATSRDIWTDESKQYLWGAACIVKGLWSEMEQALDAQEEPPIYMDLLFDAEDLLSHGQLNRCVVELATACEAFIRQRVSDSLPGNLRPKARECVCRANIRGPNSAMDLFEEATAPEENAWRILKTSINDLFSARNTVLHGGLNKALTKEGCEKFRETARALFRLQ